MRRMIINSVVGEINCMAILILFLCGVVNIAQADHMEVVIETDGENFHVISKKVVKGDAPQVYRQVLREGFYYVESLDAGGNVVQAQSFPDPTEVIYDYIDESQFPAGGVDPSAPIPLKGSTIKLPLAQFILNLPHDANIKHLRVHRQKKSVKTLKKFARAVEEVRDGRAHRINPDQPSPLPEEIELEPKALLDLGTVSEGIQ